MTEQRQVSDDDTQEDIQSEYLCPDCGCEMDIEVLDDTLWQISGGYDARDLLAHCPQCGYSEHMRG